MIPQYADERRGLFLNIALHKEERSCWEVAAHTVISREETLEMIVPDACPDIAEVVDTEGRVQLRSKECAEGCVCLSGTVPCTILYHPEGETCLRRLRAEVPFQFTSELEKADAQSQCILHPHITMVETRAVNPRKVLIRVGLCFEVTVCRPTVLCCVGRVENGEEMGIEECREEHTGHFLTCVTQRSFPFSDLAQIPGSRPAMRELLRSRCRSFVTEERLASGKLLVKGGIALKLLYLDMEEELCGAELELPFSQIMDVGNAADNAIFQTTVDVVESQIEQEDSDGRELSVELELLMQVMLREEQSITVVTDAYSIRNPGKPELGSCQIPRLVEQMVRRQSVREILETAAAAQDVCDVQVYTGAVRLMGKELTADLLLMALYRTEMGRLSMVHRVVQARCPIEISEDALCTAWCEVKELDASVTAGGIEVRGGIDFHWTLVEQKDFPCLTAFSVDTEQNLRQERQPSVVLRQVSVGETLWDVAKRHLTTREEICQANGLEDGRIEEGQLLLIPRKYR